MPQSMRPVVPEERYTTSFSEQLQLALDPHNPNLQIDLGKYRFSWENGKNQFSNEQQQGFRKLTSDELVQLMRRLWANPNVILLNLMRQGINGATMQVIAAAIAALSELQVLHLGGNFIGTQGCIILSSSLVRISHLKVLNLCENGIGAEGCIALSSSLVHLSHLEALSLDYNGIGAEGCIALSSSLVHLSHLEVLGLISKCFWIQRVVVVVLLSAAEICVCCIE